MSEIKLPFGLGINGRMISIGEVVRGLACECFCPQCKTPLVAVKGDVIRHHFRHHAEYDYCSGARETALHLFAKQLICETRQLALPHDLGPMRNAYQELWLEGIRPDVYANYDSEDVAIEIWVAHQVPAEKVKTYAERQITAVEIDLRNYRHTDADDDAWREIILVSAAREWLVPPAEIREQERLRRQQELAEQRRIEQEARNALKEAERRRAAAQKLKDEERRRAAEANAIHVLRLAEERAKREAEELKRKTEAEKTAEVRLALERRRRRELAGPNLQELVHAHGAYSQITSEAWKQWDADVAAHRKLTREGARYQRWGVAP